MRWVRRGEGQKDSSDRRMVAVMRPSLPRVMIIPAIVFGLATYSHAGIVGTLALAGVIAVLSMPMVIVLEFMRRHNRA